MRKTFLQNFLAILKKCFFLSMIVNGSKTKDNTDIAKKIARLLRAKIYIQPIKYTNESCHHCLL